jgi:hypothetical protein
MADSAPEPSRVTPLPDPSGNRRVERADLVLASVAFLLVTLATWAATRMLDVRLLSHETTDVWFEADIARVVENMSDRWSNHFRTSTHPTFQLFTLPPVYILRRVFSVESWTAIGVVLSVTAGLWASGLFAVLRLIGCRRLDATAFTFLGATSAAAMFWFAVPETHTVASLTIVMALLVVAVSIHRRVPAFVEVAVGAATLGVTVTNWMAGILASWSHRPWRQALQISTNAFALTVVLWLVGKKLTPSAVFFLGNPSESEHMLAPEALGPVRILGSFLMHTVVMPAIAIVDRPGAAQWPVMLVQPSTPGSAGAISLVSAVLWGALLLIGLLSLVRVREHRAMRLFLATFLAGQIALHLLFGNETFLYAPNFLPALIVLAALGALSPWRRIVVAIAGLLVVTNIFNNGSQLRRANRFLTDNAAYDHDVAAARAARPNDAWPVASAFNRLNMPETRVFDVGYVSAGGSFSPGLDQFTISIWVRDENGAVLANSDDFRPSPVDTTDHEGSPRELSGPIHTPLYDVHWQPVGPRQYRMDLTTNGDARVSLLIRGIGARSAPVRHLAWDGARLTINGRWVIEGDSSIRAYLVDENAAGWQDARTSAREIFVANGWAAARLELPAPGRHTLVVRDLAPERSIDRPLGMIPAPAAHSRVPGSP